MTDVEGQVLCVLLRRLRDKDLITQDVHDKAREKILDTSTWPGYFCRTEEGRKEEVHGHTQDPL